MSDVEYAIPQSDFEGASGQASSSGATDLNAAWKAQSAGFDGVFTISEGGTFELTADLRTKAAIVVDAPGQQVTIDFGNHKLEVVSDEGSGHAVYAKSASKVCLTGDSPSEAKLYFKSSPVTYAIHSEASSLVVENLSVESVLNDNSLSLASLQADGIYAKSGSVSIDNCTLSVDISNQTAGSGNKAAQSGAPSSVHLDTEVGSATLSKVTGTVHGSPSVAVDSDDLKDSGWVYGVFSEGPATVSASGCSFDISSPLGRACGICVQSADIDASSGRTSIAVEGAQYSIGIYAQGSSPSVRLAAPVSVAHAQSGTEHQVGLMAAAELAYRFTPEFSSDELSVQIGTNPESANRPGARIGSYTYAVSDARREEIANTLVRPSGVGSTCEVGYDAVGPLFVLDESNAVAEIVRGSYTIPQASLSSAMSSVSSGDTLRLLADAGDVVFAPPSPSASSRFTFDLAGHSVHSLTAASRGSLTVVSSQAGGRIDGAGAADAAAVSYSGDGSLVLQGVAVRNISSTGKAYGIKATGKGSLKIEDVDVETISASGEVRGIYQLGANCGDLSVSGGSIAVSSYSTGGSAYGISSTATENAVKVEGCPVAVRGTTGVAVGIDILSSLSVIGDGSSTDATDVLVETGGMTSTAAGVRLLRKGSSANLVSCSVSVQPGETAAGRSYWCLTSGGYDAAFSFDGTCGFDSATRSAVYASGSTLSFGSDFSLAGSQSVQMRVDGLDGPLFAVVDSRVDAEALAAHVTGASGSAYEGWSAYPTESSGSHGLSWHHDPVVRNWQTGEEYGSVTDALASLDSGQRLELIEDCGYNGTLGLKAASIDLAGHSLVVNAAASAVAGSDSMGGALRFAEQGEALIFDSSSSGGGSLDIRVGSPTESDEAVYQGVAVSGGGSLVLRDCSVHVIYNGIASTSTAPAVAVRGVVANSARVSLEGTASVSVEAAPSRGVMGAASVTGVYLLGEAGSVEIGSEAKVVAENDSAELARANQNTANLAQLDIDDLKERVVDDEGAIFYDELASLFYAKSKFDGANDRDGYEYGTQIYYLTNSTMSDGTSVWAYSDPVSAASAGHKDSIVPSYAFVSVDPQVDLTACGISCDPGFKGTVDQAGVVRASSDLGDAFALCAPKGSSWSTAETNLSASCGSQAYNALIGRFDLADMIDFSGDYDDPVCYVGQNNPSVGLVKRVLPVARPIAELGVSYVEYETDNASVLRAANPEDPEAVSVTFANRRNSDGSVADDVLASVNFGSALSEGGIDASTGEALDFASLEPSSFQVGDVTCKLAGWKPAGGTTIYDVEALRDLPIDDAVSGASSGSLTLQAVYVPLAPGQHMVRFKVEDTVAAYAVAEGERPAYAQCRNGAVTVPLHVTSVSGYTFSFEGWAPGFLSDDSYESASACHAGSLPVADSDAVYTALFKRIPNKVTLSFVYMQNGVSGYTYEASSEKYFDWTERERTAVEAANERVKAGDTFTLEGIVYTFLGWSPRISDVEPMHTDSIPLTYSDSTFSSKIVEYGIYQQEEKTATVKFYVDGKLYATAADVPVSKTLNFAFDASDHPVKPTKQGKTFRGWNTSASSTGYLYGNIKTVGSLVGDGNEVELHAIWRDANAPSEVTVSFYDEDKKTKLMQLVMAADETVLQAYDEAYEPPKKAGKVFLRWVDGAGAVFSTTETVVTDDIDVFAVYRTESSSSGVLRGSTTGGEAKEADKNGSSKSSGKANAGSSGATKEPNTGGAGSSSPGAKGDSGSSGERASNFDGKRNSSTGGAQSAGDVPGAPSGSGINEDPATSDASGAASRSVGGGSRAGAEGSSGDDAGPNGDGSRDGGASADSSSGTMTGEESGGAAGPETQVEGDQEPDAGSQGETDGGPESNSTQASALAASSSPGGSALAASAGSPLAAVRGSAAAVRSAAGSSAEGSSSNAAGLAESQTEIDAAAAAEAALGELEDGLVDSELTSGSFDGNAAGFVVFQLVVVAVLAGAAWWVLARRRSGSAKADEAVSPPEMQTIRF